ncbi:MAG: hypothetical protein AAF490_03715 [Chloroflexota bacterium]
MSSNRWQVSQVWIQHIILIFLGSSFFYWLQQELPIGQKLTFISISVIIVWFVGRWVHERFANTMVKVFELEFHDVAWLIQRALKTKTIPFVKKSDEEKIELRFYSNDLVLIAEPFPLNLMIDDHLKTIPATKITLKPIQTDRQFINSLCQIIDQAFIPLPQDKSSIS